MRISVDHRERSLIDELQRILEHQALIELSVCNLEIGDITLEYETDIFIIERKTISDLLSSIKDGRYEEQCLRLTHACSLPQHHKMYLIEGRYEALPEAQQKLVYSTITSLMFFKGFTAFRTDGVASTAKFLVNFAEKIGRDLKKGRVPHYMQSSDTSATPAVDYTSVVKRCKKQNVTSENIGSLMLCQIPGVSSNVANALMDGYESFGLFVRSIQDDPTCIDGVSIRAGDKMRKVSKTIIENVKTYFAV